jgi:glycosyltransferase involved in cell wall biosynthesis
MIWFDTTKAGRSTHHSGLLRVSRRLQAELGPAAGATDGLAWTEKAQGGDWFLTAEVFAPDERPGWADMMNRRPCRMAAVFHDAIPLRLPQVTWPQSVRRHPYYLKMLAGFDRVWAISESSRRELLGYWRWLGLEQVPPVEVLPLGADFDGQPRSVSPRRAETPLLLCVGILEPRKNQGVLLDACEHLWSNGAEFELHLVGRVNPHFGRGLQRRVRQMQRQWSGLHYHAAASDAQVAALQARARATVFPTIAEGCGLPVLESLWRGVPCVCSDLPVLREITAAGGCLPVPPDQPAAWRDALSRVLVNDSERERLAQAAVTRTLPTWRKCADVLRRGLAA